jgi:hypothetical protein
LKPLDGFRKLPRGLSQLQGIDPLDIPLPARGEYRSMFLQAIAAKEELVIDRIELEAVPRMTPGDAIDPYFILEWRLASRRSVVKKYKSVVEREVANRVAWDDVDCAFPLTKGIEEYVLSLQVFSGTEMSDFVADSRFTLPFLADFVRPCDMGRWVAVVEVQHCDHVKLAKRHRISTRAAIFFSTVVGAP